MQTHNWSGLWSQTTVEDKDGYYCFQAEIALSTYMSAVEATYFEIAYIRLRFFCICFFSSVLPLSISRRFTDLMGKKLRALRLSTVGQDDLNPAVKRCYVVIKELCFKLIDRYFRI